MPLECYHNFKGRYFRRYKFWQISPIAGNFTKIDTGFLLSGRVRERSVFFSLVREKQRKSGNVRESSKISWKFSIMSGRYVVTLWLTIQICFKFI